ncbi:MAG: asparagine synthetase B, partial [Myxococcota bacterium]|nr:asparagine synthetase B [Myxococcota bacterium]
MSLSGQPLAVDRLRDMATSVSHRGPDDAGYLLARPDGQSRAFSDPAFLHLAPGLPVWSEAAADEFRPTAFLGHRRLSIIDLSADAHQPMECPEQDLWLAYNGEVYDFPERRQELEGLGHRFRSRSDTEVVLRAFAEWGDACVERLNGMFAFAALEPKRRRLVLARDRYGIKPLYVWQRDDVLLFGSEIKALLAYAEPEGV